MASTLVHLVKRDQHATNMLDTATNAGDALHTVKERLHGLLRADQVFDDESVEKVSQPAASCGCIWQEVS